MLVQLTLAFLCGATGRGALSALTCVLFLSYTRDSRSRGLVYNMQTPSFSPVCSSNPAPRVMVCVCAWVSGYRRCHRRRRACLFRTPGMIFLRSGLAESPWPTLRARGLAGWRSRSPLTAYSYYVAPRFFSVFTRNYIRRGSHFSCVQRFAEIVGCRKLRTGVSVHFAFGARARTPPDGQQGCDQGDGNSAC